MTSSLPHGCEHNASLRGCCLLVGCLTSQKHASVSQGRICEDNFTCCHTEIEVADQTFHITQSRYIDIGPKSPNTDPMTPGAWQGSHLSVTFEVTGMTRLRKIPEQAGFKPGILSSRGEFLMCVSQTGEYQAREHAQHISKTNYCQQFYIMLHHGLRRVDRNSDDDVVITKLYHISRPPPRPRQNYYVKGL